LRSGLAVDIAGIKMKNPVLTASGTFASGREYSELIDVGKLGAIVVKGVTLKEKKGNPPPRICETPSGILNSIGLQNKGVNYFVEEELPFLRKQRIPVIVNVAGSTIEEYLGVIERINGVHGISGIELNISCPNIKEGGMVFGSDPKMARKIVKEAKSVAEVPLIVKLTPNVMDICEIASVVVEAGADALSLINSVLGMAIDIRTFRPRLATTLGGLSGPAIKPIALRMVWDVARTVDVPIIGMGGISCLEDALEFFLAGATAVAVGTSNFINPKVTTEIIDGLENFLEEKGIKSMEEIIGKLKV
jgi:dihydroorotate dehydrogenase (NAD+) catalytic subunit